MLNKVQIFTALVFNSELDSNFTNLKFEDISFTAKSYDLAYSGVAMPLLGSLSVASFHLYSTADTLTAPLITQ